MTDEITVIFTDDGKAIIDNVTKYTCEDRCFVCLDTKGETFMFPYENMFQIKTIKNAEVE